jgi:tripartite-type tricarboxylate transporter receptor subunit TctC
MINRRVAMTAALGAAAGPLRAQTRYPARPIRMVVAAAPASAIDITARHVAESMRRLSGQAVQVENKPGASGLLAVQEVLRAAPDGYTLLAGNVNSNALLPALQPGKVNGDLRRLLTPVTMMSDAPALLVSTRTGFPPESLRQAVDYIKGRPDKQFYVSSGIGTHGHVSMLLLSKLAGLKMDHVPVTSNAQAISVLQSGEVQVGFATLATILPLVQEGRFKPLAVTARQRVASLPETPTFAEAGYPAVSAGVWNGLFLPAGVPDEVVQALFKLTTDALSEPAVRASFEKANLVHWASQSPREFAAFIDGEIRKYAEIAVENHLPIE